MKINLQSIHFINFSFKKLFIFNFVTPRSIKKNNLKFKINQNEQNPASLKNNPKGYEIKFDLAIVLS